jgi:hypothetical protein
MLGTVLILFVLLPLVSAVPSWKQISHWDYSSAGGVGLVL